MVPLAAPLDRRFQLLDDGRWAAAIAPQNSTQRIVAVTQLTLAQFPGGGGVLISSSECYT